MQKPRFSLIHASYNPLVNPIQLRNYWYRRAKTPDRIEHILAFEDSDTLIPKMLGLDSFLTRVQFPIKLDNYSMATATKSENSPSAVRNWNAAAKLAAGDYLIVMSDDTAPQIHWDSELENLILRCRSDQSQVWVLDDDRCNSKKITLLPRHPVVSRNYYSNKGFIFNPIFHGRGADDDLLMTALKDGVLYDGTTVRLHHTNGAIIDSKDNLMCACVSEANTDSNILSKSQTRIRQVENSEIQCLLKQRHSILYRAAHVLLSDDTFYRYAIKLTRERKIYLRGRLSLLSILICFKFKQAQHKISKRMCYDE